MPTDQQEVKQMREAIEKLPPGTKEAAAWSEFGLKTETRAKEKNGEAVEYEVRVPRIPRHVFRDLWLAIRVYGKPEAKRKLAEPPKEMTKPQ